MRLVTLTSSSAGLSAALCLLGTLAEDLSAQAGDAATLQRTTFAAPTRLAAGERLLGEKRMYPSPAFHDVDGDGLTDIAIGDLRGVITVAPRLPGDGPARFGAEKNLLDREGKAIDFHNW